MTSNASTVMTFTHSTEGIRNNLIEYIHNSQYSNMTEEEKKEESDDIIYNLKRGLFAKDERQRTEGQARLISIMNELKERRERHFKKTSDPVVGETNKEMIKLEKGFLTHF